MDKFTVKQVADMLETNPETVRRWIRSGELKAEKGSNKTGNVITADALADFGNAKPKYRPSILPFITPQDILRNIRNDSYHAKPYDEPLDKAVAGNTNTLIELYTKEIIKQTDKLEKLLKEIHKTTAKLEKIRAAAEQLEQEKED